MVSSELVAYVRKALEKKFSPLVIRAALKKAGNSDADISAAFATVRKERPVQPKLKPIPPKLPTEKLELSDIPLPPAEPKRRHKIQYIIAAALFLLAVVLLMFAVFAPLLTNVG
ncbi:MAG TPA: hypothetical protein VJK52_02235 [Candidatus Nanoarchaeia archaeon]|nr:hypothetical protein [Candidatus Nanoarchaeia archaeon]